MKRIEVGSQNAGRANLRLIDPLSQASSDRPNPFKVNEWFRDTNKTVTIKNHLSFKIEADEMETN